jgi:PST family polysaccharide transporter
MNSIRHSVIWISAAQAFKIVFQLLSIAILARLLPPEDYGIMAMASVVVNFAMLFRDMGLSAAVVQRDGLSEADISSIFWLNCLVAIGISLLLFGTAGLVAAYYETPSLTGVLRAISPVFLIIAVAAVHHAVLERHSSFRTLGIIDMLASLIGLLVAVFAAYAGAGVYSLVFQSLSANAFTSALILCMSKQSIRMAFQVSHVAKFLNFSGNLFGFNVVNYFSRNADSLIVGRVLGANELGIYSLAYRTLLFPLQTITGVSSRALYPVMSRQQANPEEMASLYLKSLSLVVFLSAPLMAGVFVLREHLVVLAFGERWLGIASLLFWMAPVGFIQSITSTTGTVFMAKGRTDTMMWLGVLGAILQVGSFIIGVRWGLQGVAACYFIANVVNAVPCLIVTMKQIGGNFLALANCILKPFCMALVMAYGVFWMMEFLSSKGFGLILTTGICIGTGVAIYTALALIFARIQLMMFVKAASQEGPLQETVPNA